MRSTGGPSPPNRTRSCTSPRLTISSVNPSNMVTSRRAALGQSEVERAFDCIESLWWWEYLRRLGSSRDSKGQIPPKGIGGGAMASAPMAGHAEAHHQQHAGAGHEHHGEDRG